MNPEAEAKLARITELLAHRDQINAVIEAILVGRPEQEEEPEAEPVRRSTNKGRKIATPPRIAKRPYKREDVERDIEAGIKPKEIAAKHGIEVSAVYQIKSKAKRSGTALTPHPWRQAKPSGLAAEVIETIEDLRAEDKTTTEIAGALGLTFDEVASIPARAGSGPRKGKGGRPRKDPLISRPNQFGVSLVDDDEDSFGPDPDDDEA